MLGGIYPCHSPSSTRVFFLVFEVALGYLLLAVALPSIVGSILLQDKPVVSNTPSAIYSHFPSNGSFNQSLLLLEMFSICSL